MAYGFSAPECHAFDRYCVWSGFFAEMLRRHSDLIPPDSVVVAGVAGASAPDGATTSRIPERRRVRDRPVVLFPTSSSGAGAACGGDRVGDAGEAAVDRMERLA
ncbi:MAG: hypothetical protein ACODAE_00845 [Gemmatimonadota bacterium]